MKNLIRLLGLFATLLLVPSVASAATCPAFVNGLVLSAAQWQACFDAKLNTSGGTMSGKLNTSASSTGSAGLNILPGAAPVSPLDGDIWTTSSGLYVQINGVTIGPLGAAAGTVTSVGLSLPGMFTVSGSPVTSSGTLSASLTNQSANTIFAGPATGSAAAPTFRALTSSDLSGSFTGITGVGTLTTGTWDATAIGLSYGGTGANLSATGGTHQVLKQSSAGGNITVGQLACADLSDSASGCSTNLSTWAGSTSITTIGTIATGTVPLSHLGTQAADTVVANASGSVAIPTAVAIGSCSGALNALTYNTTTHDFGCNTISVAGLTVGTTTVASGTSGYILYDNAGVLGNLATTGSGNVVLATSPSLTTPNLGTPSSVTLTNATGLPLTGLASQVADTVVMRASGTSGSPSAISVPNCGNTDNAISYSTTTHTFGCNSFSGSGVPGGVSGEVQYNDSGSFGGIPHLTYDGTYVYAIDGIVLRDGGAIYDDIALASDAPSGNGGTVAFERAGYAVISQGPTQSSGGAGYVLEQSTVGGTIGFAPLTCSYITDASSGCSTDLSSWAGSSSITTLGTISTGTIPLAHLATQSANTIVMNASGSSAVPTAIAMPTGGTNGCAGTSNALTYNTSTHAFGCNTISGSGSPGGATTDVQFNSGGSFAGDGGFTYGSGTAMLSTAIVAPTATLAAGILTASAPGINLTQTWNNSGIAFTGLFENITNTASASGSLLADLQVGGTHEFTVDPSGAAGIGGATANASTALLLIGTGTPTTAAFGLRFGSDASANLYRSASGVIKTDGFIYGGTGIAGTTTQTNTLQTLSNGVDLVIETRPGISGTNLVFKSNGSTPTESGRFNSSGHFLVGTTTDNGALTVAGDVMPEAANSRNIGSASFDYANGYFGNLKLLGSTSGTLTIKSAATAGTNTLTLPAGTTDFSATGGAHEVVEQTSVGGAFTVAQLSCSDLSDAGSGCSGSGSGLTVGATTITSGMSGNLLYDNGGVLGEEAATSLSISGSQITSGTVAAARLPSDVVYNDQNQSFSKAQRSTPVTISISTSTFTPNFDNGNNFTMTLVHASCPCTLANPSTTPVAGQSGIIVINQSSTGSDTIGTWGSDYIYPGGTSSISLSTNANAIDVLSYYVINSTHILLSAGALNATH